MSIELVLECVCLGAERAAKVLGVVAVRLLAVPLQALLVVVELAAIRTLKIKDARLDNPITIIISPKITNLGSGT